MSRETTRELPRELPREPARPMNRPKTRASFVPADAAPSPAIERAALGAYPAPHPLSLAEREQLILEHLPLVRYIAKRIHDRLPPSVLLEDLIDTGVLGLIEAIQHYDSGKHVVLGAYAKHRIRGAILDSLRALDWGPRLLRKKGRDLEAAREQVQARTGRPAEEEDLAREAGIRVDELRRLKESLLRLDHSALHEQEMDEENGNSIEQQPSKRDLDPFLLCLRGEVKELLSEAIGALPERERQVLARYYYEELTMKEVGQALGVGGARVSQLHSAALGRLRMQLQSVMVSWQMRQKPRAKRTLCVAL
jgi:RNA polymerase sigma factor for flagellar operon FliA